MPTEDSRVWTVLFGSEPHQEDIDRWMKQGFAFYDSQGIRFGLQQQSGGPCGVLAVTQARVLRYLLFDKNVDHGSVSDLDRSEALFKALVDTLLLVRRTEESPVKIALEVIPYQPIMYEEIGGKDALEWIESHRDLFSSQRGILLFTMSVLLTRGIDDVQADRDDIELPLIQRFGHSTQDLVNLLLCGRAVSNVFDGDKSLGQGDECVLVLHGIPTPVQIGFLTCMEPLRYSTVGDYYKYPGLPFWIIGSTSHYSVLFGLDAAICRRTSAQKEVQHAKSAFNQLDTAENGFIGLESLDPLLASLDLSPARQAYIRHHADPDQIGMILWAPFSEALLQSSNSSQTEAWPCSACTFLNDPSSTVCDICGTSAPPEPAPSTEKAAPVTFDLFYYNGIAKADAQHLHHLCVSTNDLQHVAMEQGVAVDVGLREIIQTRWDNAVVDFTGGNVPSIN